MTTCGGGALFPRFLAFLPASNSIPHSTLTLHAARTRWSWSRLWVASVLETRKHCANSLILEAIKHEVIINFSVPFCVGIPH